MGALAVLEALRGVIVATPGMESGYRGIPEKAPTDDKLPAGLAYLDYEREGAIVHGSLEEWSFPVRVDLLVKRKGDIQGEEQDAIPLLEAFVTELRGHATLEGAGFIHADAVFTVRQLNLHDAVYVGASWRGTAGTLLDVAGQIEP